MLIIRTNNTNLQSIPASIILSQLSHYITNFCLSLLPYLATLISLIVLTVLTTLPMKSLATTSNSSHYDKSTLSWRQLPMAIRQYYQPNTAHNPLKLSQDDIISIETWRDDNEVNYLIKLQRVINQPHKDYGSARLGEVIAHLYVVDSGKVRRLWQVYDHAEPCDLDLIAEFSQQPTSITDLNHNGISEVSLPYYLGCFGGVDYYDMKIIMYEGQQKYAIRGQSAICDSKTGLPVKANSNYGGDHIFDEQLMQQSAASKADKLIFKQHLQSEWLQNQCTISFNYN